jgi:hypothetical protein
MHEALELTFLKSQVDEAVEQLSFARRIKDPVGIRDWTRSIENYKKHFRQLTSRMEPDEAKSLYQKIFGEASESEEKSLTAFTEKVRLVAKKTQRDLMSTGVTSWKLRQYQLELTLLEDEYRVLVITMDPDEANLLYQQIFEPYNQPLSDAVIWARQAARQPINGDIRASLGQQSMGQQAFAQLIALQTLCTFLNTQKKA